MTTSVSLQRAVYAALRSCAPLATYISDRIYDDIPHESEGAATFPFVTIGDTQSSARGSAGLDLRETTLMIHAWSRKADRAELLGIMDVISDALHDAALAMAKGQTIVLKFDFSDTVRDPDGETYHGAMRFRGLIQQS